MDDDGGDGDDGGRTAETVGSGVCEYVVVVVVATMGRCRCRRGGWREREIESGVVFKSILCGAVGGFGVRGCVVDG